MTCAQNGEPFSDWLMSVWWADTGKVRLGETQRVAEWALRQGRLVEVTPR